MGESPEEVQRHLKIVTELFISVGFIINWAKSEVSPTQVIEFLGLQVDTLALSFSLPETKVESIIASCVSLLNQNLVKLRDLASVLGNFSWAIPTVPFAQGHCRLLQKFYIRSVRYFEDLNKTVVLPTEARADLEWWVANLRHSNGKAFFLSDPDLEICSDASLKGWGAVCDGITTRGPWLKEDGSRHINELELMGALFALQTFTKDSANISVHLFLDNSTAVAYVNKCGGTRSGSLTAIAAKIVSWCESRSLTLTASHLPGILNSVADRESRSTLDASDWMLYQEAFRLLHNLWPMQVDLFAAAWNAQLPQFVSWMPQPNAMAVNAFSISWSTLQGYLFPPFALIPRCLAKIKKERAEMVLVCPLWTSQPWFPLLIEMAVEMPRVFRSHPILLHSSLLEPHPLLQSGKFLLFAWRLSGNASFCEAFRQRSLRCCWPVQEELLSLPISRPGTIGCAGTWRGVPILCQTL
jgi:hypothetical protein